MTFSLSFFPSSRNTISWKNLGFKREEDNRVEFQVQDNQGYKIFLRLYKLKLSPALSKFPFQKLTKTTLKSESLLIIDAWKSKCPKKVKIFFWSVVHRGLNTQVIV